MSVLAIGAVVVGAVLEKSHLEIIAGPTQTFLVAALAGFAATLAGRAVAWRLRGD